MPIDFTTIKAREVPTPKTSRGGRDLGENHWLSKVWDRGLQASYDQAKSFAAEFKGNIVKEAATRGKSKGQMVTKVKGDAGDAVVLIRQAAELLGLGVAIRTRPTRNGFVEVTWTGKKRKEFRKTDPDATTPENDDDGDEDEIDDEDVDD
jgi:hypothetical protein